MTITSSDDRVTTYSPVSPTVSFAADFPVFDNDDIAVFVDGVEREDFVITATYNLGISNDAKAVFDPGVTGIVQVVGSRDPKRTNRFNNGAPLSIPNLNLAFDTVEGTLQEQRRDANRAMKSEIGQPGFTIDADLQDGDTFMKSGDRVVKGPNAGDIGQAQGYAAQAGEARSAAEAAALEAKMAETGAASSSGAANVSASDAAASAEYVADILAALEAPEYATITAAMAATIPSSASFIRVAGQPYGRIDGSYPNLGNNVIVNGDMSSATGWTLESGWAISGGVLSKTGAVASAASQAGGVAIGSSYLVEFDVVTRTAGDIRVLVGNGASSPAVSTTGTKSAVVTCAGNTTVSVYQGSAAFVGSIDNVKVRLVPASSFKNTASGEWWGPTGVQSGVGGPSGGADGAISVKDYGASGNGITDDTVSIQSALNAIKAAGGGRLVFPKGKYRVTSTIGYTETTPGNASIVIEGIDPQLSVILYSGTGDCFAFTMGQNTYRSTNRFAIKKLGICAMNAMTPDSGAAIACYRTAASSIVPGNLFEDLHIWQEGTSRWLYGIRSENSQESWFRRLYIMFVNNASGAGIFINNSLTQPSFGAFITDCALNGGMYGVRAVGWLESLHIRGGGMAGQVDCVSLDATGFSQGAPHFDISHCHLNGKRRDIHTVAWRTVFITSVDLYQGVGSGDVGGEPNVRLELGHKAVISGCKIEMVSSGRSGLLINSFYDVMINGNMFKNTTDSGIVVVGSASKKIAIANNQIDGLGGANSSGIYVAGIDGAGCVKVNDNMIDNFSKGIDVNANNASVTDNLTLSCPTKVNLLGSNATQSGNV